MGVTKRSQRALRDEVQRATTPAMTLPEIANAAHLAPSTVAKFIRGADLSADQEQRVKNAVLWLLPSEKGK